MLMKRAWLPASLVILVGGPLEHRSALVSPAAALTCVRASGRADTTRYVRVIGPDRLASSLAVWTTPDGRVHFREEWRNGMSIETRTNDQDLMSVQGSLCSGEREMLALEVTRARNGVVADSERITRSGDSLIVFRNGVRSAQRTVTAFFPLSNWIKHETVEQELLRLVRRSPPRSVELRGNGRVAGRSIVTIPLPNKPRTRRITLFAVETDSGSTTLQWQDDNGNLVGSCQRALIRTDLRSVLNVLCTAELDAVEQAMAEFARKAGTRSRAATVFLNATVVDVERGVSRKGMSVLIEGNRISAIGPDGSFPIPPTARVIHAAGRAMVPGLWDLHAHLVIGWAPEALMHDWIQRSLIARGITAVRDHLADSLYARRQALRVESGRSIGPRIFPSGGVETWYSDVPSGDGNRSRLDVPGQVRDSASVETLMDAYARAGFVWVKVYAMLPRDLLRVSIQAAHRRGMRVSGHIPVGTTTNEALSMGFDEITHAAQAVRSLIPGGIHAAGAQPFVIANSDQLDLTSPASASLIRNFRESGASLDATLCVAAPPQGAAPTGVDSALVRRRAAFDKLVDFVRRLRAEGVPIGIGTDGCSLIREMELIQLAGFSAAEVLRMATLDAAGRMGQGHQLGSLRPGKLADLILIDGDPLAQISDLRKVAGVMKDGVYYDDLKGLVADHPFISPEIGRALGARGRP